MKKDKEAATRFAESVIGTVWETAFISCIHSALTDCRREGVEDGWEIARRVYCRIMDLEG